MNAIAYLAAGAVIITGLWPLYCWATVAESWCDLADWLERHGWIEETP